MTPNEVNEAPHVEIPEELKAALIAAVQQVSSKRPSATYCAVSVNAVLRLGTIVFGVNAYDGISVFDADTIEGAVEKVPSDKETRAARIAALKAELAKLEAV